MLTTSEYQYAMADVRKSVREYRENLATANTFPGLALPANIHRGQIIKRIRVQGKIYALVGQTNMNLYLSGIPKNYPIEFTGVLIKEKKKWVPFAEISNTDATNNPLHLWHEGKNFFFTIVDSHGGGSGEGYAKLFRSQNKGESWELMNCWYDLSDDPKVRSLKNAINAQEIGDPWGNGAMDKKPDGTFEYRNVLLDKGLGTYGKSDAPSCNDGQVIKP
jgi:hypothetical protein